jgi:hypothetical protein
VADPVAWEPVADTAVGLGSLCVRHEGWHNTSRATFISCAAVPIFAARLRRYPASNLLNRTTIDIGSDTAHVNVYTKVEPEPPVAERRLAKQVTPKKN